MMRVVREGLLHRLQRRLLLRTLRQLLQPPLRPLPLLHRLRPARHPRPLPLRQAQPLLRL